MITEKGFYVYVGRMKGGKKIVYVGTTIQIPSERFRWHKFNGKDLDFEVLLICENQQEMLDVEWELIRKLNPKMNKITRRKQNFNVTLTPEVLESRRGDKEWCQSCFKRRVNKGYAKCSRCS